MHRPPLVRSLAIAPALAALLVAAAPGTAAAPPAVTPSGVGPVKLGATAAQLRSARLIGPMRTGCELGGPGTRSARLSAPLKGSVDFTATAPRKVRTIVIEGGAKARGVGVGDPLAAVRRAYPKARVDHGTDEMFGVTLVKVGRAAGGPLQLAVGSRTRKVELIAIPAVPFCE